MASIWNLIFTFGLLAFAVIALWIPVPPIANSRAWLWGGSLALASLVGIACGFLSWVVPLWLALLGTLAFWAREAPRAWLRVVLVVLTALISLLMAMHRFPGFFNPDLLNNGALGNAPAKMHGNFDKTAVGIILMGTFGRPIRDRQSWQSMLFKVWPVTVATIVIVLGLGTFLGYVKPDFKWYPYSGLFLIGNLLSACVAEEAFFRGLLLPRFMQGMSGWRMGTAAAVAMSSILFGVVHFAGGPVLMLLATIAGILYGTAYLVGGQRVEAAILTHFALNAIHFVFFSYPSL